MNKKLYNIMDWAEVEEIVYEESVHPERILGPHTVGNSTLVQAFFPDSKAVTLKFKDKEVKMEEADEAGFYAVLIPGKSIGEYVYHVEFKDKSKKARDYRELYKYSSILSDKDKESIVNGTDYALYNQLGSRHMVLDGCKGTAFAVYAPGAVRVSLVGDFNDWDGRAYQMIKDDQTDIYELFVPEADDGDDYKYEILTKTHEKILKSDPFARQTSWDDRAVSSVGGKLSYKWSDKSWMQSREIADYKTSAVSIYEVDLMSLGNGKSIKDLAATVVKHLKEFGYTHVLINPILEYYNESFGYKPTFLFSVNHRLGDMRELASFVNDIHVAGYGVLLDMPIGIFDEGPNGMSLFDGTAVFEHENPMKGVDARSGAKMFQFGSPFVNEMVISCASYYAENFHIDGMRILDVSNMLYLNYYRNEGEWVPNIYGSFENLESIDFLKKFNGFMHKTYPGFITIADEETGWSNITLRNSATEEEKERCLGFDLVPAYGFNKDVIDYMANDPINRRNYHNELTMSMMYSPNENYIMTVSHRDVDFGKGGIATRMQGNDEQKLANLKAFYGYLFTHPGKKMIFMGQDEGCTDSFDSSREYDFKALSKYSKETKAYIKALMKLYNNSKALKNSDFTDDGMQSLEFGDAVNNTILFSRKTDKELLVIAINFANAEHLRYRVPAPLMGKYKEIFNSDDIKYGGDGRCNPRYLRTRLGEFNGCEQSFVMDLAPLSISVLSYEPYTKQELDEIERKRKEREKLINEKQKRMNKFLDEKNKIKESLKDELARKFAEAESKIDAGSESKKH